MVNIPFFHIDLDVLENFLALFFFFCSSKMFSHFRCVIFASPRRSVFFFLFWIVFCCSRVCFWSIAFVSLPRYFQVFSNFSLCGL